jgi:MBG domain (YGX type)/YDG domain/FG-GAP-like repeat/Secretion system C-terminal sorting domain/IPT/TIG domain/FG-GAP repeat
MRKLLHFRIAGPVVLALLFSMANAWAVTQPVISSFTPTFGSVGTTVTITGTNLTGATAISFGGKAATSYVVISDTGIIAIIAAGTSGIVSVTTPGGTASLAGFTYIPLPAITSFSPTSGTAGTTVTIIGANFNIVPTNNIVFFGATKATVSKANDTSLTVSVPTGATYQPISVTDITTGLTAYAAKPFITTYTGGTAFNSSSFVAKVDYSTGSTHSISVGDLDGDGKPDLAVANFGSNKVSVFRNTSTSGAITAISFAAKVDYATGSSPNNVSIVDMDGDGKPDLVVSNYGSNTVSIYRNTSTSGAISFAAKVDYATGSYPLSFSIGDLDGDGKPDFAVANNGSNTVSVFRNTSTSGTISFAAKVDYTTGLGPYSVSICDLDGDGKSDLAIANEYSNTVSVFRNTSTSGIINASSFDVKVDFTTGSFPLSVSIGDLDGDGKPDLAVANSNSNTVSVFRNTSISGVINASSFAAKVDYATGSDPNSFSIGDLDGDGKPDLAVVDYLSNKVSVLKNTSRSDTISFAAKVDYITGTTPITVSIGDLDGDGKPDLAIANFGSNTVSILRNINAPPAISSFSPTSGVFGSTVTIKGDYFKGATAVSFGGLAADTFTVVSDTSITAIVATGSSGNVSVTTPRGTASLAGFVFYPAPEINLFSPTSGITGTTITIAGTGLTGASVVTFGGTAATSFTVISDTSITAIVASGTSGSIEVTTPGGTAVKAGFTYKLSQTITFGALSAVTYGDSNFKIIATGGASGNPVIFTSSDPTVATCTGTNGDTVTIVKAGSCTISANQAGDGIYYMATQVSQSLTVNPKAITVTGIFAGNKVYDGTITATLTSGSLNGIIGPDTVTLISGTGIFDDKNVDNGKTVTASGFELGGADSGNYTLAAQPSGLTADINVASLTATADDKSKTYGDANPVFTITYTGFVNGEDTAEITAPTVACTATETSNTGGYDITLSGGSALNYNISPVNGLLTINKALLTAAADDKTRKKGVNNPVFTITYTGFKNVETSAILDTRPIASCIANVSSVAGDYTITVSGGSDNNYDFTYVSGKLTITPATGITDPTVSGYIVYPNPATDYLVIKSPNTSAINVKVFDISGRLVLEGKVINEKLNLQSLDPGLYNLKICDYNYRLIKK